MNDMNINPKIQGLTPTNGVAMLAENQRRRAALVVDYDPVRGIGACFHGHTDAARRRVQVSTPVDGLPTAWVPASMLADIYPGMAADEWRRVRCRHDFEYWCVTCVKIKPKNGWTDAPFVLNAPQRRIVTMLEEDRLANRPIRVIMLKARQWGGSTLFEMYMAWIQTVLRTNWHSLVCGHTKDVSHTLRGMYTKLLRYYPEALWEGDGTPELVPYERSQNTRVLTGRDNRITVGSAESQDAVRGQDYALAHLSEVAFWPTTPRQSPEDFVRAIYGSITREPLTMVVMESTANGVGNYFHSEWLRNARGLGDKRTVFVPWYEIEHNRTALDEYTPEAVETFAASWNDYEWGLWRDGRTLEMIKWYHDKITETQSIAVLHAEFPTTPEEAFVNTGNAVFAYERVEALRRDCRQPEIIGEVDSAGSIVPESNGRLKVWEEPRPDTEYVAAVDVGGRSIGSDWSVIAVLTRGDNPRVVAQWRGHLDHDLLGAKAVAIATCYNEARLIIESNTFESADTAFDSNLSVLTKIMEIYSNVYMRRASMDGISTSLRPGFHTNRRTKPLLIDRLIAAVRDGSYVERDEDACNELGTYIEMPNGIYAARPGRHDDILMTRALALYVLYEERNLDSSVTDLLAQPVWA